MSTEEKPHKDFVDVLKQLKMALNPQLIRDVEELHWMARRYADGRMTYAPSMFNEITRRLLAAGFTLQPTMVADKTVWADDGKNTKFATLEEESHEQKSGAV